MMWMWAHQSPTQMMRSPAVTALTAVTASTLLQLPASHVSELLPSCLHPVPESPCSLRPLLSILWMCPLHSVSLIFGKPHCSNSIDWSDLFYLCCGLGRPEWVGCDGGRGAQYSFTSEDLPRGPRNGNWSRSGYLVWTLASPSLPFYYLDPVALQGSEL